ncbi:MAG: thioredoxin domain-containing protein, partial [bacterium]
MKRFFAIVAAIVVTAALAGCNKPATTSATAPGTDSGIAAVVNGTPITMKELDDASKSQLAKMDTEIYQIKKRALDSLVEDKLIEAAAKKKGVSKEKFLAEEIDSKVTQPTEEEIKALYDARKGAINKSFDEVKGQIAEYLKQNRKAQAKADLMAKLRQESTVEIRLNPPRVAIDIKGAPAMGDEGAKITLVEFSDYQCPFCKRVRPTVWRLLDEYKGKIRYVFMDFPLTFHRDAKKASEAARCAGDQGKYFEYNRKIF